MTNNNVGHNERLYRKNRLFLLSQCRSQGIGCAHCGLPFDFDAPPRTQWAFTVDHIIPRSKGGSRDDLANMQPAHYTCNSSRGNRDLITTTTTQTADPYSEEWP